MFRLSVLFGFLLFTLLDACASHVVILEPVLKNVGGLPSADVTAIVQELNRYKYTDLDELAERVRYVFQKYGYFAVQVADPIMPSCEEVSGKKAIPVDVVVSAGKKYRIRDIGFPISGIFSAGELRGVFPIKDGDFFDREKIGVGLENLRKLYAEKGYMGFSAIPNTTVDEAARTISLRMDLDEGPLFYAGNLKVSGEESQPGAREKLLKTWKTYEGRIYDSQTLGRFLRDLRARRGVKPEQVFEVSFDADKHLANVYIALVRPIF